MIAERPSRVSSRTTCLRFHTTSAADTATCSPHASLRMDPAASCSAADSTGSRGLLSLATPPLPCVPPMSERWRRLAENAHKVLAHDSIHLFLAEAGRFERAGYQ